MSVSCACNTAISKCSLEISPRFATTRGLKSACRVVNEGQEHPKLELSGEVPMERGRTWGSHGFSMQKYLPKMTTKTDLRKDNSSAVV
jgi:hypothetical protein